MNLYFSFILLFLNSSLIILCFKSNKSLKLISDINKFKKIKKNFNNQLYSSNENLKLLKYVRKVTNASIQVCNNALKNCNNDVNKAIEYVRKNAKNVSISTNIKTQKEGLIGSKIKDDKIAILEVLTDSDFVSTNKNFVNFVKNLLNVILINDNTNNILDLEYIDENNNLMGTVGDQLNYLRNIFRENVKIGRYTKYIKKNENEFLHFYIHNVVEENVGLSGVLLVMYIDNLKENLKIKKQHIANITNDLAMHIISAKPINISVDTLSEKVIMREMEVIKQSLKDINKPEKILNNMINGKMKKFYSSVVLLEQEYMLDESKRKVYQVIKDFSKEHNININVEYFNYLSVGEKNILIE
ncbi:elongation factor ts, putative [Plasmodium gallinaceum]|uniref:Elongation factor Ts, mitochondrial n=1 Tax=Plasmodium gallinaceum TaxID=5849 RepID=A0A1J1GSJ8_PLAGA|nr:elongation factor ts, putative [Plasmodium gallinaceum]CRG95278.1 elongation factor ts, putative [Plasmodium gallinaceum]